MNRKSLLRPFGWIVWLALVLAVSDRGAAYGQQHVLLNSFALMPVMIAAMSVLTLGMPEALRRGLAKCTSRTKVVGMTITATLLSALIGAAAFFALGCGWLDVAPVQAALGRILLPFGSEVQAHMLIGVGAGGALTAIRCMEEYFHADGDTMSAVLLDVLAAVAVYAVSLMGDGSQMLILYILPGILLLGAVIALITGKKHARTGETLRPELGALLKEVPGALLRTALYPAAAAVIFVNLNRAHVIGEQAGNLLLMLTCGFLIVELFRSTFRRDDREAAGFVLLITHLCALLAVMLLVMRLYGGLWVDFLPMRGLFLYAAAATLMLLYAPLNWRMLIAGALLLAAAVVPFNWRFDCELAAAVNAGLTVIAALGMIPEWRELFRLRRVNRIRKRAMKGRNPR